MILRLNANDISKVCSTCKWFSAGTCKLNLENPVKVESVKRCKTWDKHYGAPCVKA